MSSTPGESIVDIVMRTVIDTSALRVTIASAIDAIAENTHHVRIPVNIHHGTDSKGTLVPSRCRHSAKVPAHAVASSTVAAPSTTSSFAATAAPRRGSTSIVVVTCRGALEAPLVRGSLAYSLTTTLTASTTIPVVPTYSPMTPTSPSRAGASGSPAASRAARS